MHVKKCTYRHTLHTDIHKNGTRCSHTEQPLSDQGNDKNYAPTHIHTTLLFTLSLTPCCSFFGVVVAVAAPHFCVCEPFHVSAYVCVCVCEL